MDNYTQNIQQPYPAAQPVAIPNYPVFFTKEQAKRRFLKVGLFAATFTLLGQFLALIILYGLRVVAPNLAWKLMTNMNAIYLLSYGSMYLLALPLSYLFIRNEKPLPAAAPVKYSPLQLIQISLTTLGVSYGFNLFTTLIQTLLPFLQDNYDDVMGSMYDTSMLLTFFFVVIMAPIMEEVVFRGIILSRLRGFGDKFAVIACGLFFGLWHCMVSQFFYAAAIGMVLAYVTLRTGNIKLAMFLHFLNNGLSFALSLVEVYLIEEAVAVISMVFGVFVIAFLIVAIVTFVKNRKSFVFAVGRVGLTAKETNTYFYTSFGVIVFILVCLFFTFFM